MEYEKPGLDWHGVRESVFRLAWSTREWGYIGMGYERPGLYWHGARESGFRLAWSTRVGLNWHVDWAKTAVQVISRVFMVRVSTTNLTSTVIIYLLQTVVTAIVW